MPKEDTTPAARARAERIAKLRAEAVQELENIEAELLTYEEAQDVLRISRATLYRLLREGALPRIRIRNRAYIPMDGVRDYWQRLRSEANKERIAKARSKKPARPRARQRPEQNAA